MAKRRCGKGNGGVKSAATCPLQGYRPYLKGRASPYKSGAGAKDFKGKGNCVLRENQRVVFDMRGAYQKQRDVSSEKP